MCKSCIIEHIKRLLDSVREQIEFPKSAVLNMVIEPVKLCEPLATAKITVPSHSRNFNFPAKSTNMSTAFVIVTRILSIILENLKSNKLATTRDLYYQDVSLFRSQNTVVNYVERLTRLMLIPRAELNIFASPNGLVVGDLTIALDSGEVLEVKRNEGSALIPVSGIMYIAATRPPKYILLVEKEAVFSYLQWDLPEAIMITGRGFPDRATRNLLSALNVTYPDIPIYGLVDSDPHGILILRSYECGSARSVEVQAKIGIRYLGVSLLEVLEDAIPSTLVDLNLASSTLRKPWIHLPEYQEYKTEIQRGMFMSVKGEMNLLDRDQSTRLSRYVKSKIESLAAHSSADSANKPMLVDYESLLENLTHKEDALHLGTSSISNAHNHSLENEKSPKRVLRKRASKRAGTQVGAVGIKFRNRPSALENLVSI